MHEWKFNETAEIVYCWKCLRIRGYNGTRDYDDCHPTDADLNRIAQIGLQTKRPRHGG